MTSVQCEICHAKLKAGALRCSRCGADAPIQRAQQNPSQKILRVAIGRAEKAPACVKDGTPLVELGDGLKCPTCGSATPLDRS